MFVLINKRGEIMKTVTINKKERVEAPNEMKLKGVVAFQVVEFIINYFGSEITTTHDTRILEGGQQIVIGGCGFIKDGYVVR